MSYAAYRGGRFEVFERGTIDGVLGLDINSAYPDKLRRLPDLHGCDTEFVDNPTVEQVRAADWGVVDATVTTDVDRNIQPFAVKNGVVQFPALAEHRLHEIREIFLFALEQGYITDYEIHRAALVHEGSNPRRPFRYMERLYERRCRHKDLREEKGDKHDKLQHLIKIAMNSLYGKTIQVTEKVRYPNELEDMDIGDAEDLKVAYWSDRDVVVERRAGELFNPFYAAYITGLTRLQLHRKTVELGLEQDCIMHATDCLTVRQSDVDTGTIDVQPRELGGWDYEYRDGSAFVVGAGVYDIYVDGEPKKWATRGYLDAKQDYDSWRSAVRHASNGVLEIEQERPVTFREYLEHPNRYTPAEFGEFRRELRADMDKKRVWGDSAPDFGDLLSSSEASKPLELDS